jgi:hypothetical protein
VCAAYFGECFGGEQQRAQEFAVDARQRVHQNTQLFHFLSPCSAQPPTNPQHQPCIRATSPQPPTDRPTDRLPAAVTNLSIQSMPPNSDSGSRFSRTLITAATVAGDSVADNLKAANHHHTPHATPKSIMPEIR